MNQTVRNIIPGGILQKNASKSAKIGKKIATHIDSTNNNEQPLELSQITCENSVFFSSIIKKSEKEISKKELGARKRELEHKKKDEGLTKE